MSKFSKWEFLIQEEVTSAGMIRLPEQVKEIVGVDHLIQNASVYWSIEKENRFLILSESPLENEIYSNIGMYKIYDIESLDESGGRIRPPKDVSSLWASDPESGQRVFYLTHTSMCRGSKSSVYLLSEDQVLDLLPTNQAHKQNESIEESLFDVPAINKRD